MCVFIVCVMWIESYCHWNAVFLLSLIFGLNCIDVIVFHGSISCQKLRQLCKTYIIVRWSLVQLQCAVSTTSVLHSLICTCIFGCPFFYEKNTHHTRLFFVKSWQLSVMSDREEIYSALKRWRPLSLAQLVCSQCRVDQPRNFTSFFLFKRSWSSLDLLILVLKTVRDGWILTTEQFHLRNRLKTLLYCRVYHMI